ncbi:transaldolase [Pelagicoccus sp. SDUM812005]|uniref:transaldolase n=1 Tax=Pelagicoccus sp. SDUM812005 TaxID=3041257 RepID=UPI00280E9BFF|nr:transaldolase [Pelagicoccus sp. SDUM812005]MDQ8181087.1 transaldolase [Pelagicoccus sp. SDUM812005]
MMNSEGIDTVRLWKLAECGQSYWLDNLTREMLHNGELSARIQGEGLRGITSNPKTFSDSVRSGTLYNEEIESLVAKGESSESIYEALMVSDVQRACDEFENLYRDTEGRDGYVSIEVDPRLAREAEATLVAARGLWKKVNRPNAMIKIPATVDCLPTIEEALVEGINVNITLIFSVSRYREVAACYLRALRRREKEGREVDRLASVASFFLSRVDAKVDGLLEAAAVSPSELELAEALRGKAAIALARTAYSDFKDLREGNAWKDALESKGARPQRLLWASTSVKDDRYPESYYVDALVGKETVNTMPESTAEAFAKLGTVEKDAIERRDEEPEGVFEKLCSLGIDLEAVAQDLEEEGIQKFVDAFEEGLLSVTRQAKQVRGDAV